ncbi:zinc finger family protein [Striga asiatica]|uniref:Zinc finger family protein n=1 Tax=Striga asiatica TaxID=4170 RepID=A0A5A7R631_STRAF|nr:zinc finger family protein [Striga asiatica]
MLESTFQSKPDNTFEMYVELQIPKEERTMDMEDHKIESQEKKKKISKRVCHICSKEFDSGKALGGHMRIHLQLPSHLKTHPTIKKPNNKKPTINLGLDNNHKKPNCVLCGKNFPSWKSLYGHMRCHPDRGWKGINPPSFSSSSSSDSSSLSNEDNMKIIIKKNRAPVVDLAASIKGWSVTAERGRKASSGTSSEISSELLNAVNYLLMLSRGGPTNPIGSVDSVKKDEHWENKRKKKADDDDDDDDDTYYTCDNKSLSSHNKLNGIVVRFDLNEMPPSELESSHLDFTC